MADEAYYTPEIIDRFIRVDICQNDPVLYKYFQTEDVDKFRHRIPSTVDIEKIVQTYVTDATRSIVLEIITKITRYMRPMGDLIVSGGEAFNTYFDRKDRIVTGDIDTKFTPTFVSSDKRVVSINNPKYFGYLQVAKLLLWNYIGYLVKTYQSRIIKVVQQHVVNSKLGRLLGIRIPSITPKVTRRYTLLSKTKQSSTKAVKAGDTLIDVELFCIDLKLLFYSKSKNEVKMHTVGGILDIAFMRPKELGYEVKFSRVPSRKFLVASKKFLIEDLFLMQELKLRPLKKDKDRLRMFMFAQRVLGVKDIKKSDPINVLFEKSIKKVPYTHRIVKATRPIFTMKYVSKALKVNPSAYEKYTSEPSSKVFTQMMRGTTIKTPGYHETRSRFRFDIKNKIWVRNDRREYIKNEFNYRPNERIAGASHIELYGYNPNRDSWMPNALVKKASMIPFIGLKNKSNII